MSPAILMLSLLLNAETGEPQGPPTPVGVFDSVEQCHAALIKTGKQTPKDGKVLVFGCQIPLEKAPVEIPDDKTRATT